MLHDQSLRSNLQTGPSTDSDLTVQKLKFQRIQRKSWVHMSLSPSLSLHQTSARLRLDSHSVQLRLRYELKVDTGNPCPERSTYWVTTQLSPPALESVSSPVLSEMQSGQWLLISIKSEGYFVSPQIVTVLQPSEFYYSRVQTYRIHAVLVRAIRSRRKGGRSQVWRTHTSHDTNRVLLLISRIAWRYIAINCLVYRS